MKKTFLILAAAATMLAACTKDPQEAPVMAEGAIGFDAYTTTSAATKGSVVASTDIIGEGKTGIGVFAFYQPKATGDFNTYKYTTPDFMYNQQVGAWDASASVWNWTYDPVKFWPNNEGDELSFFAYAPYDENKTWEDMGIKTDVNASKMAVSFPINGEAADQKDYLWADPQLNLTKPSVKDNVIFAFSHVTSQVNLYVGVENDEVSRKPGAWTDENTEIEIKSIELKDLSTSLNYTYDLAYGNSLTKAASTAKQNVVLTGTDFEDKAKTINTTIESGYWKKLTADTWTKLNKSKSTMFLAPGESLSTAVVTYTVTTKDAKLNGSKSVITNTVTCDLSGISALEAQKVYNLQFLIGMTSVKVSATVADWDSPAVENQINMPVLNTNYLTFTFPGDSDDALTLKRGDSMEISDDAMNWSDWTGSSHEVTSSDHKVYVRAKSGATNTSVYGFGGNFTKVEGNVMMLVNSENANYPLTNSNFFDLVSIGLFTGCTSLVDASGLVLPATKLAESCYSYMFAGCEKLTTAPALPATKLAESCYSHMFDGCEKLTTAPALPATTLANFCYDHMFAGCENLTTAPALPATTLAFNCYLYMFQGCNNFTSAPALPATTLAIGCYGHMFESCTSLTSAPALPATTLADACYSSMFSECFSLTTAPALPATKLAESCYSNMFAGCEKLTTAPALPATTLAEHCYDSMFSSCSFLTSAPALPATTLAVGCYSSMFSECNRLTSAPALPATTLAVDCYSSMFNECYSLTTAPDLPAQTLVQGCYICMFECCYKLSGTVKIYAASPYYSGSSSACASMFFDAGSQSGSKGTIYVADTSDWNSYNAGISSTYWDVNKL